MQNSILSATEFNQQAIAFHAHAANKGFYEDYPTVESRDCIEFRCKAANLIYCEVAEAYEAFRSGKIDADIEIAAALSKAIDIKQDDKLRYAMLYKEYVKGTVAEELADAYIRTCDTVGAMGLVDFNGESLEYCEYIVRDFKDRNWGVHRLFTSALQSFDDSMVMSAFTKSDVMRWFLAPIYALADYFKIDLHLHVKLKAFYNTTRGYKHGRKF